MAVTLTSTMAGASADYVKYLWGKPVKTDRYKDPWLLDFSLAPVDASFVKLTRGSYIVLDTTKYPKWFTGYIINDPDLEFLGSKNDQPVYGYRYRATSDEYILNLKPLGLVPMFFNVSQGAILKQLAEKLAPGLFNTTGVQDGPIVAQYAVDPESKFFDVAQEFQEASGFFLYANDKKLFYKPQDTSADIITLDGNNQHFTHSRLDIRPSADPIINDVTVYGLLEPQRYVTEYFVGTGLDSAFPLTDSVFGADTSVLIDETFEGSAINTANWGVYDTGNYLKASEGYLNSTGGDNGWTVSIRSASAIPLDGRIRFTHGEWDFLPTSGAGMVGSLWTQAPNAAFTGCIYGLSYNGTTLRPVVNAAVDNTQTLTIDTSKRYIIRTVVEFLKMNRIAQSYAYIDEAGVRQVNGGDTQADVATWETIITVVNPADGTIVGEPTRFSNTSTLSGAQSYGTYIPLLSSNLKATVTGITVSVPINASLETCTNVQLKNLGFETWVDNVPTDWNDAYLVSEEALYANSGKSCKMENNGYLAQAASGLVLPDTQYEIFVRMQKTASMTTGTVRFYLESVEGAINTPGLVVTASQLSGSEYLTFTGVLTTGLSTIPADLMLKVDLTGANAGYAFIDDISITTQWVPQLIGPNEIDASDGLAPVATIVAPNTGSETRDSLTGVPQHNPGQSQLVFFKDSVTRTSSIPPQNQILRLTYRSAGPGVGRAISQDSINTEAGKWLDDGTRAVVRADLTPRPRSSKECELAAAAIVGENSFQHYEGKYTQYSEYFSSHPMSGAILKFTNTSAVAADLKAEEITEVRTTLEAKNVKFSGAPTELFVHELTFGKTDRIRRLLRQFSTVKGTFQHTAGDVSGPVRVGYKAVGLTHADDVTKPTLVGWDGDSLFMDAGQNLGSGDLHFEVRLTDEGWGVDDGKNLVTRSTSRLFAIPRALRGKVFYIRIAKEGNKIRYSEELAAAAYSGASIVRSMKLNPDGNMSEICAVTLAPNVALVGTASGSLSGNCCWSFSIKGAAGTQLTATFGTGSKTFKCSGAWQRVSVSSTSPASTTNLVCVAGATVDLTRYSVESGTLVERAYSKTTGNLYGPVSRYSAVIRVSFPAPAVLGNIDPTQLVMRPTY